MILALPTTISEAQRILLQNGTPDFTNILLIVLSEAQEGIPNLTITMLIFLLGLQATPVCMNTMLTMLAVAWERTANLEWDMALRTGVCPLRQIPSRNPQPQRLGIP